MASQAATTEGMREEFDFASDPLDYTTSESILPSLRSRIPRDFTITTDSYISLCSRVYAACCSAYPEFGKKIPESAFQYYAVILLWRRVAEILPNSAKSDSGFFNEIATLQTYGYIPVPLKTYLKGIGYFSDPDGCERRFVLPVVPSSEKIAGVPYTFGKVNAKTHFFYEAFPAPGIAALRIQADIKYTDTASEKNLLWNLPEGLHPDIQEAKVESVVPTANLLGWAPAQRLTNTQMEFLKTLKIDDNSVLNNFGSSTASVHALFGEINNYFECWLVSRSERKSTGAESSSGLPLSGSLVQGMAVERHYEHFRFDRSAMYCDGNVSVCSPYQSTDALNKGAVISGYRMAKEPIGDRHCWACYDFDEYKHVPESWVRSRNSIYTYGNVGRLNETVYTTGVVSKRVSQNECIQYTLFETPSSWNIHL